jgi:hypothetical protein
MTDDRRPMEQERWPTTNALATSQVGKEGMPPLFR